jgi:hypothetical protein
MIYYSMYAHMMMTTEYSPIPGGSRAVADRRVILTDWRRYDMRAWIQSIACSGKWSTRSAVRVGGFAIDVSQHDYDSSDTASRLVIPIYDMSAVIIIICSHPLTPVGSDSE